MKMGRPSNAELVAQLKEKLAAVTSERDDYHGQLRRRETDFENRTKAVHSAEVMALISTVETNSVAARKSREAAKLSATEADELRAQLAGERIQAEGVRVADELAAQKKFNIAMSIKERMIATRDMKLAEAHEAAAEIQRELDVSNEVSAQRLLSIRSICGKLGGQPRKARTEDELEADLADRRSRKKAQNRTWPTPSATLSAWLGRTARSR